MALVTVPARDFDVVIVCEYVQDNQARLYDEPVLAWVIDDTTHNQHPVIPGSLPGPPTTPAPTRPQWVGVQLCTDDNSVVIIVPDVARFGSMAEFCDWFAATAAINASFLAPVIKANFESWAYQNQDKLWPVINPLDGEAAREEPIEDAARQGGDKLPDAAEVAGA